MNAGEFLRKVIGPGDWMTVVAIHPETERIFGQGFQLATIATAEQFIAAHSDFNLYWTPNPLKKQLDKKPEKIDVAQMRWVHLDLDDPSEAALARLRAYRHAPTIILFSGGGYQAFWLLRTPILANGNIAELEAANQRVIADLAPDDTGTHNIDRIMRLPGTTNWPTKTKLARGRVPAEARLIEHHPERAYDLSDFPPVSPTPPTPKKKLSRSEDLLARVGRCVRARLIDDEIHRLYDDHDPHARDQHDPSRAVQRAIDKVRAADVVLDPVVRCVADVEAQPLLWLVPKFLPLGKFALLAGDPGLGKSQITLDLTAAVTTAPRDPWTGAMAGEVVLLNAEDDIADTVRPRLEAAGADLSRVHVLEAVRDLDDDNNPRRRQFHLAHDIEQLRAVLDARPAVRLVNIDPISAYLGGLDSHRNTDVRSALAPLAELAAERSVTVLAVSHLNKSSGNGSSALYRITGSLAFVAAARVVLAVVKDEEDPERRLLLPVKHNLARTQDGWAYRVVEATDGVPRLRWENTRITTTADEALTSTKEQRDEEVADWLREELAGGPRLALKMWAAARERKFSNNRVKRTLKSLGIKPQKEAQEDGLPRWTWALPGPAARGGRSPDRTPWTSGPLGPLGPLEQPAQEAQEAHRSIRSSSSIEELNRELKEAGLDV